MRRDDFILCGLSLNPSGKQPIQVNQLIQHVFPRTGLVGKGQGWA